LTAVGISTRFAPRLGVNSADAGNATVGAYDDVGLLLAAAYPASSGTTTWVNVEIRSSQRMPFVTSRLTGIDRRWPHSTQDVLSLRYGFQVVWVDARGVATEMIEDESDRDRADESLVDDSMCS
jgi:hypothetical protein